MQSVDNVIISLKLCAIYIIPGKSFDFLRKSLFSCTNTLEGG